MTDPKPEKIYDKTRRHIERRRKPKGPTARRRAAKSRNGKAMELKNMKAARARDVYCRFPMCGCQGVPIVSPEHKLKAEVSHQKHRGMGGNPSGDRTTTALLLLLCNWRHKLSKFSVDRKGIRWEALTDQGADGPIRWLIQADTMRELGLWEDWPLLVNVLVDGWAVLVEETEPHCYKPFTAAQSATLAWLAEMTV